MKTQDEIINIAQKNFEELNKKYDKLSNYLIFDENGAISYKKNIDDYRNKHNNYQDIMGLLQEKNNWSTSVMYYAIAEISKCANCSSLCHLLLPKLYGAGINKLEFVFSLHGTKSKSKSYTGKGQLTFDNSDRNHFTDHAFIIVQDAEGVKIVVDPYFDLVCPLEEFQVHPKVLAFFKLSKKETYDFKAFDHSIILIQEEDFKKFNQLLKKQLPLYLNEAIKYSDNQSSIHHFFQSSSKEEPMQEYQKGNYKEAEILFKEIAYNVLQQTKLNPNRANSLKLAIALYNHASCLLQLKDYQTANNLFNKALALRTMYDKNNEQSITKIKNKITECAKFLSIQKESENNLMELN